MNVLFFEEKWRYTGTQRDPEGEMRSVRGGVEWVGVMNIVHIGLEIFRQKSIITLFFVKKEDRHCFKLPL